MQRILSIHLFVVIGLIVLGLVVRPVGILLAQEVTPAAATLVNAKIKVNTLTDEWDTDPATKHTTKCSLREALQATVPGNPQGNQGCGKYPDDTPSFTFELIPGTYVLTRLDQLPNVMKQITIDGKGKDVVKIDGGGQSGVGRKEGIFIVGSNGDLILSNLTLQHGTRPFGGALWIKDGKATVKKVRFYQNLADNGPTTGEGGAIRADTGQLTVLECEFEDNTARNLGGALSSGGVPVLIEKSKFIKNHAEGGGGALAFGGGGDSYPTVNESEFRENWVYVVDVPANYDPKYDAHGGGAVYNYGKLVMNKSQFIGNYSERAKGGGAFFNAGNGDATLIDVAMKDNKTKTSLEFPVGFGGAILNEGVLNLVRTSLHDNTAQDGGAILNRQGGKLNIANSTLSRNQAGFAGGILNGMENIDTGGEIYLYHATIARNQDEQLKEYAIYSEGDYKVWMWNSILDTGCNNNVNSYGYNIFVKVCPRVPADQSVDLNTDRSVDSPGPVGLKGLAHNGGPDMEAGFYSIQLDTGKSNAIDAASAAGCAQALVANVDQANRKRGSEDPCDTGALESGTSPSKFNSTPAPGGTLLFPPVVLNGGSGSTQTTVELTNQGGGVLVFQAEIDESWDNTFKLEGPTVGYIFKDQKVVLTLSCTTSSPGNRYGSLLVKSDAKNQQEALYKLSCPTPNGQEAYAGAEQKPGPLNAGQPAPGETTQVTPKFTNHGNKPLDLELNVSKIGDGIWQIVGKGGTPVVAAAAVNAGAVRLGPNETFEVEIQCTPTLPGVYVNTITLTTNDPINPTLDYDISCEGVERPTPEKLDARDFYSEGLGKRLLSLALSPDGAQLLTGHYDDNGVGVYSRNPAGGILSLQTTLSAPGMSQIFDLKYSHDGKNVYYTSRSGDGVVVAQRDDGGSLAVTQVITKSSKVRGCLIGDLFLLCPLGTMDGAEGLAVSPDDKQVYVSGTDDSTLTVFNRNTDTGSLTYSQRITRTIDGVDLLGGAHRVLVSDDGENVYVAGYNDGAVVSFARRPDGQLKFLAAVKDDALTQLAQPSDLALSPDGAFVYVPSHAEDAINVFRRAPGDGVLELVQTITGVDGAYAATVSHDPEGERVLVVLYEGNAVQLYGRNRQTGELTFVEQYTQLPNSGAMNRPYRIATSTDDRHVYVAFVEGRGVLRLQSLRHLPGVFTLSPASAPVGGADFILTVNGQHFYADSTIVWNGSPLTTNFVNAYQLKAIIPGGNLGAAGSINVSVRTNAPGGGDSNAVSFTITEPSAPAVPSIESLNPPAANYGSEPLNVVAKGANFTPQSQAFLNGNPVATTYINPTTLLIELTADDLSEPGALGITVVNQTTLAAGVEAVAAETVSSVFKFATAAPGEAALPSITNFTPGSVVAGSTGVQIAVHGHNFSNDPNRRTVVLWNGAERSTIVVDANKLLMTVTDGDVAAAGQATVVVFTPDVGESLPANYTVRLADANPAPLLSSSYAEAENGQWLLTVNGSDFAPGATLLLNGGNRATNLVSGEQVTAQVAEADLTAGGVIQVINPSPGGGLSNELVLAPRLDQAITFDALADRLVTSAPFTVTATASSELAVSISSNTPAECTVAEGTVTLVAVGVCTLVAAQAGDGMYNPAPPVERGFQVLAQPPAMVIYLPVVTKN